MTGSTEFVRIRNFFVTRNFSVPRWLQKTDSISHIAHKSVRKKILQT
ncbi:Uncharacterized protein dnm_036010 [Desulfonema magnum]|uniref:Uncharacterized protein n=1 Tax=Desulfonema magnum TaxID=45655 RepID=A0A975GNA8_9BACT|nr:Uncharacterized protein dnm_036010 [Desulfonema magnum]